MSVKLGLDARLYFCAAGIGGTPTWAESSRCDERSNNVRTGHNGYPLRIRGPHPHNGGLPGEAIPPKPL